MGTSKTGVGGNALNRPTLANPAGDMAFLRPDGLKPGWASLQAHPRLYHHHVQALGALAGRQIAPHALRLATRSCSKETKKVN